MRTVAVTINKGGVGKTTLTKSLATAATAAGLNVLILDMDTQENAASWGKRRKTRHDTPLPLTRFTTERGLPEELQLAETAGCDLVFIDTPPGRNSEAPAAVECSDLVLIPFWNDQDAYEGVARTALLVKRLGKPAVGVLNFATPNSRTHAETARVVLEAIPLPMSPIVLHRYDAHRLADKELKFRCRFLPLPRGFLVSRIRATKQSHLKLWYHADEVWGQGTQRRVERLNLTFRMAMRRLTRLTSAFSKKLDITGPLSLCSSRITSSAG